MMLCPIGAEQETAYLAALAAAQTYRIVGPNMQITYSIEDESGVLNFTSRESAAGPCALASGNH